MPAFLIHLVHQDERSFLNFRYAELDSLGVFCGLDADFYDRTNVDFSSPFLQVELPSEDVAKKMAQRGILIKAIYEVWGKGVTMDSLVESLEQCPDHLTAPHVNSTLCFRLNFFGQKKSQENTMKVINRIGEALPLKGRIDLTNADQKYTILGDFGHSAGPKGEPKMLYFGREVAVGDRSLIWKHTLKKRKFVGPTSTDAELSFLMANQALACTGKCIYDPFVGTGSLLVSCAYYGACVIGSDIDIRVLKGKGSGNVFTNFEQYGLPPPELLRSDNSMPVWRTQEMFDAIICDPPYGMRAGARKSGSKKEAHEVEEKYLENHIPATQVYPVGDVMTDLMLLAAKMLTVHGRLVYLLPCTNLYTDADLPLHPCLEIIANSEQKLQSIFRRRLITMVKTKPFHPDYKPIIPVNPSHANIKDVVFQQKQAQNGAKLTKREKRKLKREQKNLLQSTKRTSPRSRDEEKDVEISEINS